MKEARSPHPQLLHEWRFLSAADMTAAGWTGTNMSYSQGAGVFNESAYLTSKIKIPNGTYSVRIKCKVTNFADIRYLFDARGAGINGIGYVFISMTTGIISPNTGVVYVNGVATVNATINSNLDIIVSGITLKSGTGTYNNVIGARVSTLIGKFLGSIDLIQIYKGTLTASEVRNLYNNKTFKELAPSSTKYPILDVHAFSGSIVNRANSTAITNTNVSIVNDGGVRVMRFNGTDSKLDCGAYNTLVGDITVSAWVKASGWGEGGGSEGDIVSNTKISLPTVKTNNVVQFTSNSWTNAAIAANNSMQLNKYRLVVVTRKTDGKASFYINGVISSTADQNSGTPVAGSNIIIGNHTIQTRTFNGNIARVTIYSGILSADEIQQVFDSQRLKFGL